MSSQRSEYEPRESLQGRLDEAEQTLEAIRNGEVDAVVVSGPRGPQVYSLEGPDRPFRVFVEHMQQGAVTLGCDETILYCNSFFADLVKAPLEQVMGRRFGEFLQEGPGETVRELIDSCLTAPASAVVDLLARDGERIPAHLSMTPLSGSDPATCCVVVADLREREKAHEARVAQQAAEAANLAKDQFLAILSHELRAPLNSILGWAQILQRMDLGEEALRGLESIERNARAQTQLIGDLLDTSRIAAGKLRLDLQTVCIDEIVESAVASIAPTAEAQEIRIESTLASGGANVIGDPARLQQIVWNLLTNAVKYSDPGGEVRVETRQVGERVEIEVTDEGQGMSPDLIPKLFELFQQAEISTTRRSGGLGLGLAIAKQLVELHRGEIRAESRGENMGSTFTVALPVGPAAARSESYPASREVSSEPFEEPDLRGMRILVVDDDLDARELFRRTFSERGVEVLITCGADEAIRTLESERRPDVILCDIAMPIRDGYDLIRDLRARGLGQEELPAIAVSALARAEDRSRALDAGYQAHFAKPVNERELLAKVADLVRRSG